MKTLILTLIGTFLLGGNLTAFAGDREAEALNRIDKGALLIDVRTQGEFAAGHLEGAANIPHQYIVSALGQQAIAKDQPIVVYCRSGNRSGIAQRALSEAGYTNVFNGGGLNALQAEAANR